MEEFLKWRDSWLTGIEALDVQHAELATCLNSIARLCFEKEDQDSKACFGKVEQVNKLALQLYNETKQHFKYEEQLMLETKYPGYPAHSTEHGMLLAELKLLIRTRSGGGCESIDTNTLKALKSWFIAHIAHSDKLFARFVSKQNACETVSGGA